MSELPPNLPTQSEWPKRGYYYHYKHDPRGVFNNYAYYIYGIGHHTEDDCRPEDKHTMVYRPLYEAFVYKNGKQFDIRPLHMFFKKADWQGKKVERFVRITNPTILSKLETLRTEMYPEE